jgi:hypothetical protein
LELEWTLLLGAFAIAASASIFGALILLMRHSVPTSAGLGALATWLLVSDLRRAILAIVSLECVPGLQRDGNPMERRTTMTKVQILGTAALALVMLAAEASAQRGGGAVRGGMRGAVVGGMVGGEGGAATGAKVGAVTGATRAAIGRETQARTQYATTTEYQNAQHSNFSEAPPVALDTTPAGTAKKASGEAVIRKDGRPIVGITFPADWNQKTGDNYISAVSGDAQAYAMLVTLGAADKQAAIKKVKDGLENRLTDVKYDEPAETKGGAAVITGTGKGKKAGVDVVFAAGILDAGKGQLVGAAFVADAKMEDHYKETVRGICQTLRVEKDFTHEVAKPVTK